MFHTLQTSRSRPITPILISLLVILLSNTGIAQEEHAFVLREEGGLTAESVEILDNKYVAVFYKVEHSKEDGMVNWVLKLHDEEMTLVLSRILSIPARFELAKTYLDEANGRISLAFKRGVTDVFISQIDLESSEVKSSETTLPTFKDIKDMNCSNGHTYVVCNRGSPGQFVLYSLNDSGQVVNQLSSDSFGLWSHLSLRYDHYHLSNKEIYLTAYTNVRKDGELRIWKLDSSFQVLDHYRLKDPGSSRIAWARPFKTPRGTRWLAGTFSGCIDEITGLVMFEAKDSAVNLEPFKGFNRATETMFVKYNSEKKPKPNGSCHLNTFTLACDFGDIVIHGDSVFMSFTKKNFFQKRVGNMTTWYRAYPTGVILCFDESSGRTWMKSQGIAEKYTTRELDKDKGGPLTVARSSIMFSFEEAIPVFSHSGGYKSYINEEITWDLYDAPNKKASKMRVRRIDGPVEMNSIGTYNSKDENGARLGSANFVHTVMSDGRPTKIVLILFE